MAHADGRGKPDYDPVIILSSTLFPQQSANPTCLVYGAGASTKKKSSMMFAMSWGFWSGRTSCSPAAHIRPSHLSSSQWRQKQDQTCVGCVTTHQSSSMQVAMRTTISKNYTALHTTIPVIKTRSRGFKPHFPRVIYMSTFYRESSRKKHRLSPTAPTALGVMVSP